MTPSGRSPLPVEPPLAPMLARLSRELPLGDYLYEPKWDGFRCLAFRSGDAVDLRSRHDRPLARYFPELVEALLTLPEPSFVLDGEIVVRTPRGADFAALLARLHPAASRVQRLRVETPAAFVAFDLLARGDSDVRERGFAQRRAMLAQLFADVRPPLHLTPATDDAAVASEWLRRFEGGGVDGVVAKHATLEYRPGARAMIKVKLERTADCVVAGFREFADRPLLSALMLGLYDDVGRLEHVGAITAFPEAQRRELDATLRRLAVPLQGHPWEHGFLLQGGPTGRLKGSAGRWTPQMGLDWVPLAPVHVCEAGYDQLDGSRFRHPARFRRWRPDREPTSCTFDQLESDVQPLAELLSLP